MKAEEEGAILPLVTAQDISSAQRIEAANRKRFLRSLRGPGFSNYGLFNGNSESKVALARRQWVKRGSTSKRSVREAMHRVAGRIMSTMGVSQ